MKKLTVMDFLLTPLPQDHYNNATAHAISFANTHCQPNFMNQNLQFHCMENIETQLYPLVNKNTKMYIK